MNAEPCDSSASPAPRPPSSASDRFASMLLPEQLILPATRTTEKTHRLLAGRTTDPSCKANQISAPDDNLWMDFYRELLYLKGLDSSVSAVLHIGRPRLDDRPSRNPSISCCAVHISTSGCIKHANHSRRPLGVETQKHAKAIRRASSQKKRHHAHVVPPSSRTVRRQSGDCARARSSTR